MSITKAVGSSAPQTLTAVLTPPSHPIDGLPAFLFTMIGMIAHSTAPMTGTIRKKRLKECVLPMASISKEVNP